MAQKASPSRVAARVAHHRHVSTAEVFSDDEVKVEPGDGRGVLNGSLFRELRDTFGYGVIAVSKSGTIYLR